MIFAATNDNMQWSLDFGPDSVVIQVKDLELDVVLSRTELPLAVWSLLENQRQQFLTNHLARVPITPNQQGTMEMREEVLSSIGAQDVDTRDYHIDELDDIQFYWEDPQALIDAEFRPGIDTPYSPSHFDDVFGSVNNPIVITTKKTRRMKNQPLRYLRDLRNPHACNGALAVPSKDLKTFPIECLEICLIKTLYLCSLYTACFYITD